MTTESFLQVSDQEGLYEQHFIQSWSQEYQRLQYWQKMLSDYEEALDSLKQL